MGRALLCCSQKISHCCSLRKTRDHCLCFQRILPAKQFIFYPVTGLPTFNMKMGKKRKEEFYYGNTFYSQSGRYIIACVGLQSITITDDKGKKATRQFLK
jgi:hypothetical protein